MHSERRWLHQAMSPCRGQKASTPLKVMWQWSSKLEPRGYLTARMKNPEVLKAITSNKGQVSLLIVYKITTWSLPPYATCSRKGLTTDPGIIQRYLQKSWSLWPKVCCDPTGSELTWVSSMVTRLLVGIRHAEREQTKDASRLDRSVPHMSQSASL